jgi:hypothetical protein
MMGQQQIVAEQQAGDALRRIVMVVLVAALMALMMAASAMPALATPPPDRGGENYGGNRNGHGDGVGGTSPFNGSAQGVSKKEQNENGVIRNPHLDAIITLPF